MSSSLTIENVHKTYPGGDAPVLDNLSFEAEVGEFIVLVGPSGCGKSTMLRSIAGLETVDSGHIKIGDRDVTALNPKDRHIAMVFQDYALYPHKSVFENMAFGLRIRKFTDADVKRIVNDAAEKLNLTPLLERKPSALSGGQRQRVAIGRAIVRDPEVFLFDEPLSNLDAKLRGSMRLTIGKLHKELNATVVYVTHDQIEAMTLADKIIVLEGGKIQQMGSPLDLYYHPVNMFVAGFIGAPPMNMLEGKLIDDKGLCFESTKGLKLKLSTHHISKLKSGATAGKSVVLGIRPENLKLAGGNEENYPVLKAEVVVSEPLGAQTNAFCSMNGHEVHMTFNEPHRPAAGETLEIYWKSKHLYLFDQQTRLSLTD